MYKLLLIHIFSSSVLCLFSLPFSSTYSMHHTAGIEQLKLCCISSYFFFSFLTYRALPSMSSSSLPTAATSPSPHSSFQLQLSTLIQQIAEVQEEIKEVKQEIKHAAEELK